MSKEDGSPCRRAKKGRRTVSPSHRVINLSNTNEGRRRTVLAQDGGVEKLVAEINDIAQLGRVSKRVK